MECIIKVLIFNDLISGAILWHVSYMMHCALSSGVSYMIHFKKLKMPNNINPFAKQEDFICFEM